MTREDLVLGDGRRLVVYDAGPPATGESLTVLWHHGSPQTGALLEPLLEAASQRGIRMMSYARPSYGGSSPDPGRNVASAAADVRQLADALGLKRFAVMGASGGGPHALACAALLPDRVLGVVCLASPAPFTTEIDWFAGMRASGGLRSARLGRDARARYAETEEFDEDIFIPADWAALQGPWASLGRDARRASEDGPDGLIDDDVAFASDWGVDLSEISVPVLLIQGDQDRVIPPSHAQLLKAAIPSSELRMRKGDGHLSVLDACPDALDWLLHLSRGRQAVSE